MNAAASILLRAREILAEGGYAWALVGGWAVSAWTEPRFTRDVDLAVAVDGDEAAQRLAAAFQAKGFRIKALVEQDGVGRLATVRLCPPEQPPGLLLDLLVSSSGIEEEVCKDAEPLELFPGVIVPIARPEHLLALKVLARDDRTRPQDTVDIRSLISSMDEAMLAKTRQALGLILARGYHRGRNLSVLFDGALAEFV